MLYEQFADLATEVNSTGEAYLFQYGKKDDEGYPIGLERITTELLSDAEVLEVENVIKEFMNN